MILKINFKKEKLHMIEQFLKERNIPPLLSREEMLDLIQREEYGYLPQKPDRLIWEIVETDEGYMEGKATYRKVMLTAAVGERSASFPVYAVLPKTEGKHPFFLHLSLGGSIDHLPLDLIIGSDMAVLQVGEGVATDDDDFTNGVAVLFDIDRANDRSAASKIALWSWAMHRAIDYAETVESLDVSRSSITGHSRLGKTVLYAGATDERIWCTFSINSGSGGAALSRGKVGETVAKITDRFPYWFCPAYKDYADKESELPLDQHYVIASIAPRLAYVASAWDDGWADPQSEYLGCVAADRTGKDFVHPDRLPEIGDCFHDGPIGYHMRAGGHSFNREDWTHLIEYVEKHK